MPQKSFRAPAQPAEDAATIERRVWVRFPTQIETFCKPFSAKSTSESEMSWSAQVRDISQGGLGLSLSRRFEPKTILIVELPSGGEGFTRLLPVKVVHTRADGPGRWIVGCTFASRLSEAELQAVLQDSQLPHIDV